MIACNLHAIPDLDRPHYFELVRRLRQSVRHVTELPTGYRLSVEQGSLNAAELAEWAAMERLCCPFLEIVAGDDGTVRLTGAAGLKEFLAAEFTSIRSN